MALEHIVPQMSVAVAGAWTGGEREVIETIRPEQIGRRNFARDIEEEKLHLPLAIVQFEQGVSATEYSADRVALRIPVTIYRVERWEAAGGDQSNDVFGRCADLLVWLMGNALTGLMVEFHQGVRIDASPRANAVVAEILKLSMPFTCASLTVNVICPFR